MKRCFAILIPIICFNHIVAQTYSSASQNETVSFIKNTFHDKRDNIFLSSGPSNKYTLNKIRSSLLERDIFSRKMSNGQGKVWVDTFLLSKSEREYIDSCLKAFETFIWNKEVVEQFELKNIKAVDFDTLTKQGEKSLIIVYQMVCPIFLRNNSVAFFYKGWHYYQMGLGGHGELGVYKKENNEWKLVWRIYEWDS